MGSAHPNRSRLSLRDSGRCDRCAGAYVLACLERRKDDLAAAGRARERARTAVGFGRPAPDEGLAGRLRRGRRGRLSGGPVPLRARRVLRAAP
ncbi:hypothetical protein [Streptomyces sp. NPDC005780]|uniref:hypothetical protein n=1 Tax=Streptomyces sp. NPDC005780 TaxID=3364730 RepID=UPI00367D879E